MCASYSAAVASSLLIGYSAFKTPWAFGEVRFATNIWWFSLAIAETERSVARCTEDNSSQKGASMTTITVSPVHFEDYSGIQFERLVFAYHLRAGWHALIWHG